MIVALNKGDGVDRNLRMVNKERSNRRGVMLVTREGDLRFEIYALFNSERNLNDVVPKT